MKFRKAAISDIHQIQAIEEDFYEGFKLTGIILRDWIDNLSENFLVAEDGRKLVGCIFWEQLDEIKAIPYFHQSQDFHKSGGEYAYISEVGVLDKNADLLQQLFNRVVKLARQKNIKTIIWVTGLDEGGHTAMERDLIEKSGFKKLKPVGRWEYAPGKFSKKHWIFIKELK